MRAVFPVLGEERKAVRLPSTPAPSRAVPEENLANQVRLLELRILPAAGHRDTFRDVGVGLMHIDVAIAVFKMAAP